MNSCQSIAPTECRKDEVDADINMLGENVSQAVELLSTEFSEEVICTWRSLTFSFYFTLRRSLGGYQLQASRKPTTAFRVGLTAHTNSRKVNGYQTIGKILLIQLQMSWMKVLLGMLPAYYNHVRAFENTLVIKFFGLHYVKITGPTQKKVF
ncbi:uncharacterized protein LOC107850827 isoform X1 [Capsicum annuum]|uniref:uncharacterized protein LOC107850827 isoform X1 n=1 Tax=Capsicum annuum TaxID=4072 RepID=UPI001FB0C939|nr:uncharacterized protein LOC107850827 isoform X1 [Capsicum annuum]